MTAQTSATATTGTTRQTRRSGVTLDHVWLALVPLLVALKVLLTPITPHDFWWHMAYGREIFTTGSIPPLDTYSYTQAGAPYFDQPWLAQVLMYLIYQGIGAAGFQVLQAVLVAGTYLGLVRVCMAAGADRRIAVFGTLLAAVATYDNWQIRPQTFALPLWVLALGLLERWRRTGRTPWLLVPILIVWSNLHGTFTLPIVFGGLLFLGEGWGYLRGTSTRSRADLLALAGCLAVAGLSTAINPHGPAVWWYVVALLGNNAVGDLVTEWAPPRLGSADGTIFFVVLAIALVALIARRKRVPLSTWLAFVAFAGLALQAGRNIIWFVPLATLLITPLFGPGRSTRRRESPVMNGLLLAILALPVVLTLPPLKAMLELPPRLGEILHPETPVAAVAHMRELPEHPQRLFHDSGFGSYLMWAMPEQRVFIDPRIEHYPIDQWYDYINLGNAQDIRVISDRYSFDGYLLNPASQSALITALRQDPAWTATIDTPEAVLFQSVQSY